MRRVFAVAALFATLAVPTTGAAQTTAGTFADLSIEDLMNITITSASHKEQRAGDVAAAISVITQEDIRRSGMRTLPELLRGVPGVQVAQINSNKWAVAVRGFNNLFADKLLVLVDGRTVYDRLNSGLFWESLDVPLDQIERVEVIRGPGGATWGANAVNGVINIVMKSAADLPGGAVTVGGGLNDGVRAGARYGGLLGGVAYRVYSQWAGHEPSLIDATTQADDRWESQSHGFRLDWTHDRDTLMAEGGVVLGKLRALFPAPSGPVPAVKPIWNEVSYTQEYDVLGRWSHRQDNGSALQVQSSLSRRRNDDGPGPTQLQADIAAQYQTRIGDRHDVVAGLGYRRVDEQVDGSFGFSIDPGHVVETVVDLFAQDELALGRRVHVTLGAKLERESYLGWDVQPTARAVWTLVPHQQRVWGAVSRATRTPSLGERSGRYNFASFPGPDGLPIVVGVVGDRSFRSERVVSTEAGYRRDIGSSSSLDVATFLARYDHLKTSEPLVPRVEMTPAPAHLFVPTQFGNLLEASTFGVELGAHWSPAPWWRIDGSYSTFHLTPHLSATSGDMAASSFDGNAPGSQWHARSAFSLGRRLELDAGVFHAGALPALGIAAYTRVDARLALPIARELSLALVGQNLFDSAHAEYAGVGAIVTPTLVPRTVSIAVVWSSHP